MKAGIRLVLWTPTNDIRRLPNILLFATADIFFTVMEAISDANR